MAAATFRRKLGNLLISMSITGQDAKRAGSICDVSIGEGHRKEWIGELTAPGRYKIAPPGDEIYPRATRKRVLEAVGEWIAEGRGLPAGSSMTLDEHYPAQPRRLPTSSPRLPQRRHKDPVVAQARAQIRENARSKASARRAGWTEEDRSKPYHFPKAWGRGVGADLLYFARDPEHLADLLSRGAKPWVQPKAAPARRGVPASQRPAAKRRIAAKKPARAKQTRR